MLFMKILFIRTISAFLMFFFIEGKGIKGLPGSGVPGSVGVWCVVVQLSVITKYPPGARIVGSDFMAAPEMASVRLADTLGACPV